MKRDIYNYEKRLEGARKLIEKNDEITKQNRKLILDFLDDCRIDGAGHGSPLAFPTTTRHAFSLLKVGKWMKKDFRKASKRDIKELVKTIELYKCAEATKYHYKVGTKKFYKWLNGGEEYPDCVKWIKLRSRDEKKYPWIDLTEEDIIKMVKVQKYHRDKAFIMALADSRGRIGEIGPPQIKHLKKWKYGYMILLDGKTGQRPIPLIASAPFIDNYLNFEHPDKDNPEAYLFVKLRGGNYGKPMDYAEFRMMLIRSAKIAGVKARANPHSFRHLGATKLYRILKKDPATMNQIMGWGRDSKMWKVYLHLSGEDVEDPLLEFYGIKREKKPVESLLKPKICKNCEHMNGVTSVVCQKCTKPLDENNPMDIEQQRTIDANATAQMFSQPDSLENFVKKMIEEKLNEILQMKNAHPNLSPPLKEHAIMVAQRK